MADSAETEHLKEQTAAAKSHSETLQQNLSDLAGRLAETEDEMARVHEHIAHSKVSATAEGALKAAEEARRYADHERQEQLHWTRTDSEP